MNSRAGEGVGNTAAIEGIKHWRIGIAIVDNPTRQGVDNMIASCTYVRDIPTRIEVDGPVAMIINIT